jgi:hypothetical protein
MLLKFDRRCSLLTVTLLISLLIPTFMSCSVKPAGVPQDNTIAPAPLEIKSFEAQPKRIKAGETTTLTWNVTGATAITMEPGTSNLPGTSGSAVIAPQGTTLYTLTATDGKNEATSKLLILVESSDGSLIWPAANTENVTEQLPYEGWIGYPNKYVEWQIRDSYKYPNTEDTDLCQQFGTIANNHNEWIMTNVFITNVKIADRIMPGQTLEYTKSVNCKFPTLKWKWLVNK